MRGKVALELQQNALLRITPAYAGKSFTVSAISASVRDHPRLCGEKFRPLSNALTTLGSPPPMRGKALLVICSSGSSGITPAYAGKSQYLTFGVPLLEDHPRLCGEKHFDVVEVEIQFRITPAYAGKRCIPLYPWNRYKDNPRLCGEKSICRRSIFGYRGSPPPMRGKV